MYGCRPTVSLDCLRTARPDGSTVELPATLLKVVEVSTHVTMHPDLLGSGRVRLEYDSTFRVPIAGPFTYSLRIYDRFDNQPASAVKSNDYGIVSGLGVSF